MRAAGQHVDDGVLAQISAAHRINFFGSVLAEQHDEWTEGRRYMSLELLAKSRIRIVPAEPHLAPSTPTMTTETLTA
jgi:putative transposase